MNNAIRALGQQYSARWMERLGGRLEGGRVLEGAVAAGSGWRLFLSGLGLRQLTRSISIQK
jgi:hypothetical protein